MGGGLFVEIILFAVIAAALVWRLRSVLGRRHGEERQRPNPYVRRPDADATGADGNDNVVQLPDTRRAESMDAGNEPVSLSAKLTQVKVADPSFDEKPFLGGAQAAFGMIVTAFAEGDTATIRPFLSDQVFENFSSAIRQREDDNETLSTEVSSIDDVDIVDAAIEGGHIFVTVRFVSQQINVTRDSDGDVVDGNPEEPSENIDIWTFARNVRSNDPNWQLTETRNE